MKQKPAKSAIDEFGYLVSAEDFRFPSVWKLYCFHCSRPMQLVLAHGEQEAHFLHDAALLVSGEAIACPNLETPQTQRSPN